MEAGDSYVASTLEAVLRGPDDQCFLTNFGCSEADNPGYRDIDDDEAADEYWNEMLSAIAQKQCCLRPNAKVAYLSGSAVSVESMSVESLEDGAIRNNFACIDWLDFDPVPAHINLMRGAIGDAVDASACGGNCPIHAPFCDGNGTCVVPSCELHAPPFCNAESPAGARFRQMCPVTCGCDSPQSSLVLSMPADGCGQCTDVSQSYMNAMATLPCEDVPIEHPAWLAMLDAFAEQAVDYPNYLSDMFISFLIPMLRSSGCAAFDKSTWFGGIMHSYQMDFCTPLGEGGFLWIKPFSYFCPASCGCRGGDPHCPDQCPADATHWWYRNVTGM